MRIMKRVFAIFVGTLLGCAILWLLARLLGWSVYWPIASVIALICAALAVAAAREPSKSKT
jgi:hypothetical protein